MVAVVINQCELENRRYSALGYYSDLFSIFS